MRPDNPLHKDEWLVDEISHPQARDLIQQLHYSHSVPNTSTERHGLFRRDEWPLILRGAAMWMPPASRIQAEWAYPGGDWRKVLVLSRLVIQDGVPTNAASFMLGQCVKRLRARWECLLTYADEWQQHTGGIYVAAGWDYLGTTKPGYAYRKDGKLSSRKRGPVSRSRAEMLADGYEEIGPFVKHKFRKLLK